MCKYLNVYATMFDRAYVVLDCPLALKVAYNLVDVGYGNFHDVIGVKDKRP